MTIKRRIILSSALLLTLFSIMCGVNWQGKKDVMNKNAIAYLLEEENMHLQGVVRGTNTFIIDEGGPLSVELVEKHIAGFEYGYNKLISSIEDKIYLHTLSRDIYPQWQAVKKGIEIFIKNNPDIRADDDRAMLQYGKLSAEAETLLNAVSALARETQEAAQAAAVRSRYIVKSITGIAFVILIIISLQFLKLYKSITAPLKEIQTIAEGYGEGNFDILMDESRKDEFGSVASHFNKANIKLNTMQFKLKEVSNAIASNSPKICIDSREMAKDSKDGSDRSKDTAKSLDNLRAALQRLPKVNINNKS
jgi:methyl-accepting chemotaxis protein